MFWHRQNLVLYFCYLTSWLMSSCSLKWLSQGEISSELSLLELSGRLLFSSHETVFYYPRKSKSHTYTAPFREMQAVMSRMVWWKGKAHWSQSGLGCSPLFRVSEQGTKSLVPSHSPSISPAVKWKKYSIYVKNSEDSVVQSKISTYIVHYYYDYNHASNHCNLAKSLRWPCATGGACKATGTGPNCRVGTQSMKDINIISHSLLRGKKRREWAQCVNIRLSALWTSTVSALCERRWWRWWWWQHLVDIYGTRTLNRCVP